MLKQQLHEPFYSAEAVPLGTQSLTVPLMGSNAKAIHDPTQSFRVKNFYFSLNPSTTGCLAAQRAGK